MGTGSASETEDHRVRSGRQKRERMRAHLLEAVLSIYPSKSLTASAVIDDVIRQAGVSRGTFYKYFDSLEAAVIELAGNLADDLAESYAGIYENITDARIRAAIGFQLYLSRAAIDPHWGAFVSHLNSITRDSRMNARIRANLQRGVDAGVFHIADMDVALDMTIGFMLEGIRHVSLSPSPRRYTVSAATMLLRSLGVPGEAADTAVALAATQLAEGGASGRLSWWSTVA